MKKRDAKAEIVEVAHELFNRYGYADVSMRDIAEQTNMSKGNLTYHFPRKEDIALAIVRKLVEEDFTYTPPDSVEVLCTLLDKMRRLFKSHVFCFHYLIKTPALTPALLELRTKMLRRAQGAVMESLERLEKMGQLRPEAFPGQWRKLAMALAMLCMSGAALGDMQSSGVGPDDLKSCMEAILLPCKAEDAPAQKSAAIK